MNCPSCGREILTSETRCAGCGAEIPANLRTTTGVARAVEPVEVKARAGTASDGGRSAPGAAPPDAGTGPAPSTPASPPPTIAFRTIDLRPAVERSPTQPPPPEAPPPRTARRGARGAAIAVALLAFVALDVMAFARQKQQTGALILLGLAGLIAVGLIVFVVARSARALAHPSRVPLAVGLIAALAVVAVPVVQLGCFERLGPGASLQGCNFANAHLQRRNLAKANLQRADLRGAYLDDATLTGADLRGAKLTGARASRTVFDRARLDGATFDRATLTKASLKYVAAPGASFRAANLEGANFFDAALTEASFSGAAAAAVSFEGAHLNAGNLDGADLTRADLSGADLTGASSKGTTLFRATLGAATLQNAVLDEAKAMEAFLDGANLTGASVRNADLSTAKATGSVWTGATLDGATLQGADLSGADLSSVHASGANFAGATLSGANFAGATLTSVKFDGVSLVNASGLSDRSLASASGVGLNRLGPYLTTHDIRLEPRASILSQLGAACRGVRVSGAAPVTGSMHPLVLLNGSGRTFDWTDSAQTLGWEPMATRFGQLVACVQRSESLVQRCLYREIGGLGRIGSISRYRQSVRIRLIRARSGATVLDRRLQGSNPSACPRVTAFQTNGRISGSDITFSAVRSLLLPYAGRS